MESNIELLDPTTKTKRRDSVVIKNQLFNCSYTLTLWQEKLIRGILYLQQQERELDYLTEFVVDKVALKKLVFGNANQSDKKLITSLDNILKLTVALRSPTTKDVILTHWIQSAVLPEKDNKIKVIFDKNMVDILRSHGNFTLADSGVVFGARCVYTERLYPLLKQYKDFGKRTIMIEEIIRDWQLPKSYFRSAELKERVIDKAVIEINKLSDIWVGYSDIKQRKKVIGFEFKIAVKAQEKETIETTAKEAVKDSIKKAILEWCSDIVLDLCFDLQADDESTKDFEGRLLRTLEYCKKQTDIKDKAKFFHSVLKKDYSTYGIVQNIFESTAAAKEFCKTCKHDIICNRQGKSYKTGNDNKIELVDCEYCEVLKNA